MIILTNHITDKQNVYFVFCIVFAILCFVWTAIKPSLSNKKPKVHVNNIKGNSDPKSNNEKIITEGMTTRQVIDLIGEPAVIDDDWLHPNRITYVYGKRSTGITLIFESNSLVDATDKRRYK